MIDLCSVITALAFFLMPAQTTLYSETLKPIVELPAGYFVLQQDIAAPDGYISVVYDDLSGYVSAAAVQAVDYTPVTKYETTVTFRCNNDGQPVNLRAAPSSAAPIVSVLNSTATGRCYGTLNGEALFTGGGTLWYYVKANGAFGYCYYAHVDVDKTPPNIIEKEEPPVPDRPAVTEPAEEQKQPQTMPTTAVIIFIVALCVPVPFIMFYLFKKPKDDL